METESFQTSIYNSYWPNGRLYPFEKQGQKQLLFAESCLAYFGYNWEQAHCFRNESIIKSMAKVNCSEWSVLQNIIGFAVSRLFDVLGCVEKRQWDMFPTIANPKCIVKQLQVLTTWCPSYCHWPITVMGPGSPEGGVAAAPYCWHGTNSCHLTWIGLWHWRLYLERKSFSPSCIGYEMPDKIAIICTNSERNTRPGDTSMFR